MRKEQNVNKAGVFADDLDHIILIQDVFSDSLVNRKKRLKVILKG